MYSRMSRCPEVPWLAQTLADAAWRQLTDENTDARVWSGIHSRSGDQAGVQVGRAVAGNDLRHASRLFG